MWHCVFNTYAYFAINANNYHMCVLSFSHIFLLFQAQAPFFALFLQFFGALDVKKKRNSRKINCLFCFRFSFLFLVLSPKESFYANKKKTNSILFNSIWLNCVFDICQFRLRERDKETFYRCLCFSPEQISLETKWVPRRFWITNFLRLTETHSQVLSFGS